MLPINDLTEIVIGLAYKISNSLGHGFLEKIYENALKHELKKNGIPFECQKRLHVIYDGILVGEYVADLLVDSRLLVELKSVNQLDSGHGAQCLNYLKATRLELCLLLNFGTPRVGVKRIINDC